MAAAAAAAAETAAVAEADAVLDADAAEEVENLLESYFMQIDRTYNRLKSLEEFMGYADRGALWNMSTRFVIDHLDPLSIHLAVELAYQHIIYLFLRLLFIGFIFDVVTSSFATDV